MTNPNNPDSSPAVAYLIQRADLQGADLQGAEMQRRCDDLQTAREELLAASTSGNPVRYSEALDRFTDVLYRGTGVDQQVNRSLTREGVR